jgi:transcriptional regulator with PAS, ATPase and Fis domain
VYSDTINCGGFVLDTTLEKKASIDLLSLVNSHEKPFVVIDKNYNILAVNKAYEQLHSSAGESVIGRKCYQVSHKKKNDPVVKKVRIVPMNTFLQRVSQKFVRTSIVTAAIICIM